MSRTLFYARVSSKRQKLDLQLDEARRRGIPEDCWYVEKMSGMVRERPELARCLAALEPGDTLLVWRLNRAGRSMIHLCQIVEELTKRGIHFATCDGIATTGPAGKLVLHMFAAVAEFERESIIERVLAGQAAAKERGAMFGRPQKLDDAGALKGEALLERMSPEEAASILNVSKRTLFRGLKRVREKRKLTEDSTLSTGH